MPEMGVSKVVTVMVMTTTQRDALAAVEGMVIFNSTTDQLEEYDGSTWQAVGQVIMDTHEADIDIHHDFLGELLRTGEYIGPPIVGYISNLQISADTLYAFPLLIARDVTADRIAIDVESAATANKDARLGIYNNGTNLYPDSLLLDAGTIDVDSTGVKAITIDQALTKGLYWLAIVSDGAPSPAANNLNINVLGMLATDFASTKIQVGWSVSHTYAALPDPFTAGGSAWAQRYTPSILLRLSSLD